VQILSKLRPSAPVFAFCQSDTLARRLALWRGVIPLAINLGDHTDQTTQRIASELRERGFAEAGADVVIVGSSQVEGDRRTNLIRLLHIRGG
jgi:pyruvate kinase